jgi:hypothetical protein
MRLVHNPGYHARDYKEDHKDQEDDAIGPFRSMKRFACRNFDTVRDIDLLGLSHCNCDSTIRSSASFGDCYTVLYKDGGFALCCPEGTAISTY